MEHLEASLLLGDLLQGHLEGTQRRDVEAHIASCSYCQSWCETYRSLRAGFDEPPVDHPASDDLVLFVLSPEDLPPTQHATVAQHLSHCDLCQDDADATRQAVASLDNEHEPQDRTASEPRSGTKRLAWRLAAALALAVLAAAYFLRSTEPVSDPSWSGVVDLQLLEAPLRGDSSDARLTIGDEPFVLIALPLDLPPASTSGEVQFRLLADGEREVWREQTDLGEVRRLLERSGVLTLAVPTVVLEPGLYGLEVSTDSAPTVRFSFEARIDGLSASAPTAIKAPQ
ncbi:MAG: hypothetical protein AAF657_15445 [Acidobacteriota bacterium]